MARPDTTDLVAIAALTEMWGRLMPDLRDQVEADLVNRLLGNILAELSSKGKKVPPQVFVAAGPPGAERADPADPASITLFETVYRRWDRSSQFKRFYDSLSEDERREFWRVPA